MAINPIQRIANDSKEAGIPFPVIGGFAVHANGYVRTTDDLDLVVPSGQRARWSELLNSFGMIVKNDAATFLQFDPADKAGMEVD